MQKLLVFLFLLLCVGHHIQAQDTTTVPRPASTMVDTTSADQMLAGLTDSVATPLLPHKMIFTQQIFWGRRDCSA
ncbi:hypothetical protein [Spirosoma telluris]|uniref:hypothetical protein n=1 Tax=Spirosoma telluris TaxID=2183553 RepID=UPI0038CD4AFE